MSHELSRLGYFKYWINGSIECALRGLLWPTFVIGAEAHTPTQKSVIVESYGHSWAIWRCENVTNALRLLQRIWGLREAGGMPQRWIEYVYESGEAWMFV